MKQQTPTIPTCWPTPRNITYVRHKHFPEHMGRIVILSPDRKVIGHQKKDGTIIFDDGRTYQCK